VKCFCFQDSARRAHSIAAQGGINAAKNYQNDGDSVHRLFYDTVKGGDFRARESNVHRLAEVSVNIIDQCVAQGVPFAREYGGMLANRSFGGAQVSRTFYARGQTGQQLLLGAYSALNKEIAAGGVQMYPRTEMLDVVTVDGHAKGHHHAQPRHRQNRIPRGRRGAALHRRLRQRFLPLHERDGLQRHRDVACAQEGRVTSRIPATRRSIRPASR
jgi:succinate dehydrogenase/fumarate reductase flavoprotein subunit